MFSSGPAPRFKGSHSRGVLDCADIRPPGARLDAATKTAMAARWDNIQDIRQVFPDADQLGQVLVFNIRHNRYRLIATVFYRSRTIYIKALLMHKEYDREEWKKWA